jgi:hypothetical protein
MVYVSNALIIRTRELDLMRNVGSISSVKNKT